MYSEAFGEVDAEERRQQFSPASILDNLHACVYAKDLNGRYTYVNQAFCQLVAAPSTAILGSDDSQFFSDDRHIEQPHPEQMVLEFGQPVEQVESGTPLADGRKRIFRTIRAPVRNHQGQIIGLCGVATDITHSPRGERELKPADLPILRSEVYFQTLFEATGEAVLVLDGSRFFDCNQAALNLYGVADKATLCAIEPTALAPEQQPCGTRSATLLAEHLARAYRDNRHRFEWLHRRLSDGVVFPCEVVFSALRLAGRPMLLAAVRDFSERKRYEEQIHHLAFYDGLTNLPNRSLLYDRLDQAMAMNQRSGHHGAVIFLDLDNFKPLNDKHGHAAGDLLLKEVARRLSHSVRGEDTVARMGGDEFVVLLVDLDKSPAAAEVHIVAAADAIRKALALPYRLSLSQHAAPGKVIHYQCTASLGVTLLTPTDKEIDPVFRRADNAMYQAKADGRNRVRISAEIHG